MTARNPDSALFFYDGHVVNRNIVLIPAGFNAFPDADATRIALWFDNQWFRRDFRGDSLRSVTFHEPTQHCFFAGRNGAILRGGNGANFSLDNLRGSWQEQIIDDVIQYGELFRIRSIANSVYACGQSCQVYKLINGQWDHFDDGILDQQAETLEDIDGFANGQLFSVGLSGTLLHYNGGSWKKLACPTNAHLSNIRCLENGDIYFCGNSGVFYVGDGASWMDLTDSTFPYTFWGMEHYNNKIYLAHSGGLIEFDGRRLIPVDFGIKKEITFNRLHSRDGVLYSFGADAIIYFDGSRWRELVWIDN